MDLLKLIGSETNESVKKQIIINYLQECGANFIGLGEFKIPLASGSSYFTGAPTLYISDKINIELTPIEEHVVCSIFNVVKIMYVNPDIGLGTNLLN